MSEHESARELLALAAAGVLSADEQRLVESHARTCAGCAAELAALVDMTAGLRRLPMPPAPLGLAERTRRLIQAEAAQAAERRWNDAVAVVLALFTWTLGLAFWLIVQLIRGGPAAIWNGGFLQTSLWVTASTVLAWLTAGVAAVVLGHQRRLVRRSI